MSKQGRFTAVPYKQAGQLTPDEAARERTKVRLVSPRHDVVARPEPTPVRGALPRPETASPGEPVEPRETAATDTAPTPAKPRRRSAKA